MSDEAVAEIEALEDRRWAAQIGADLEALDQLLAPDLVYTHSNGLVDTKASYISAIEKQIFDYQAETRSDTLITVVDGAAVVTGRSQFEVVAGGRQIELDCRYTAIWARRDEAWQFLCWQSTPVQ